MLIAPIVRQLITKLGGLRGPFIAVVLGVISTLNLSVPRNTGISKAGVPRRFAQHTVILLIGAHSTP